MTYLMKNMQFQEQHGRKSPLLDSGVIKVIPFCIGSKGVQCLRGKSWACLWQGGKNCIFILFGFFLICSSGIFNVLKVFGSDMTQSAMQMTSFVELLCFGSYLLGSFKKIVFGILFGLNQHWITFLMKTLLYEKEIGSKWK